MTAMMILACYLIAAIEIKADSITVFLAMLNVRKSCLDPSAFQLKRREAPVAGKDPFCIVRRNNLCNLQSVICNL